MLFPISVLVYIRKTTNNNNLFIITAYFIINYILIQKEKKFVLWIGTKHVQRAQAEDQVDGPTDLQQGTYMNIKQNKMYICCLLQASNMALF